MTRKIRLRKTLNLCGKGKTLDVVMISELIVFSRMNGTASDSPGAVSLKTVAKYNHIPGMLQTSFSQTTR
jgi:hypothetical protein